MRIYISRTNGTLEQCAYEFDANGNRTKLTLPNNDEIRYFYYGTGHLSAIKYNDKLITEIKRDARHQEIERTQGELTSYFNLDPLGRLAQQRAISTEVNNPASGQILSRNYQYDRTGNLAQVNEQRRGKNSVTHYRYDKLGQLKLAGDEMFSFDPAHNIIEQAEQKITNNQVSDYQGIQYRYDELGNLSERILPNGEIQTYRYNLKDQLIEARIQKPNQPLEIWEYDYDALGRRINKRLKNGGNLQETRFVWDGSHLIREENANHAYSYIYTHPSSYEPLAQLHFAKDNPNSTACNLYYYHTDQIGVPRELTDEQGKICWYGDYSGWGKLKDGYDLTEDKSVHQPFRLQNQYADEETGLHYNFFRYYEPNMGRFTQLDPIGLTGGMNLYRLAGNVQGWIDPLGLEMRPFGYSREQLNDLAVKAQGDYLAHQTVENAIKTPTVTGATFTQVEGNVSAIADGSISAGYGVSRNENKQINKCGYIQFCGGGGLTGGASGSIQQVFVNQPSSEGFSGSISACNNYAAIAAGGVTGSMCQSIMSTSTKNQLFDFSTQTVSGGLAAGVKAGGSITACLQVMYCSKYK